MTRHILLTGAAVVSAMLLAACGGQDNPQPAVSTDAAGPPSAASNAPAVPAAQQAALASATGEVTAIDKAKGSVTLNHAPIPQAGWPAMTMAFKVDPPALVEGLQVGDKVAFDLRLGGGSGVVTNIRKQ